MLIYARPTTGLGLYHVILEDQRDLQVAREIIYSYGVRGLELRLVSRVDAGVLLCTYVEILILSVFFAEIFDFLGEHTRAFVCLYCSPLSSSAKLTSSQYHACAHKLMSMLLVLQRCLLFPRMSSWFRAKRVDS